MPISNRRGVLNFTSELRVIEICRSGDATDSLEAHFLDAKNHRRYLRDFPHLQGEYPTHLIYLRSGEAFTMNEQHCFYSSNITSVSIYDIAVLLDLKRDFIRTLVEHDGSEMLVTCAGKGAELAETRGKNHTMHISLDVSYVGAESQNDVDCSAGPSRPEKLNNNRTPTLK